MGISGDGKGGFFIKSGRSCFGGGRIFSLFGGKDECNIGSYGFCICRYFVEYSAWERLGIGKCVRKVWRFCGYD